MNLKRLPDAELEVMKALWESGPDTHRSDLDSTLTSFSWTANTINTYLVHLTDKGFVSARWERRTNLYTPRVTREEYHTFKKLYS